MNLFKIFKSNKEDANKVITKVYDNQVNILKRLSNFNVSGAGSQESAFSTIDLTLLAQTYTNHIWVYACIYAIAVTMSSIPLKIYKKSIGTDGKDTETLVENKDIPIAIKMPNKYMSFSELIEAITISLESTGRMFVEKAKVANDKQTKELYIIAPQTMKLKLDRQGRIIGFSQSRNGGIAQIDLNIEDIIHTKYYDPMSDADGMSPLRALWQSLLTDFDAIKFNRSFLKNQAVPYGVLETEQKLDADLYERLYAAWTQSHQGSQNAGKIAILEGGLKFNPISFPPKDLEFMAGRKLTREEILSAFKVPPIMVGLMDGASYANAYQQYENFILNTIVPKLKKLEGIFNNQLLKEFNVDYVCRFDLKQFPIMQEMELNKIPKLDILWKMGVPFNHGIKYLNISIDPLKPEVGDKSFINGVPSEMAGQQQTGPQFNMGGFGQSANKQLTQQTAESLLSEMKKMQNENIDVIVKKKYDRLEKKFNFVKSFIKNFDEEEKKFIAKLAETFKMQKEEVISKVKSKINKSIEEKIDIKKALNDDVTTYTIDIDKNNNIIVDQYLGTYKDLVKKGAGAAKVAFGLSMDLETIDQKTLTYLKDKVYEFAGIINDTTNKQIQAQISKTLSSGLEENMSIADITEKIILEVGDLFDTMSIGRAKNIAQTEITGALNYGALESYKEAGIEYKEWLDVGDEKTRDGHETSAVEIVKVDEPFIVNGEELMYPGDPNGDPSNICNCRCTHVPYFKD